MREAAALGGALHPLTREHLAVARLLKQAVEGELEATAWAK